MKTRFIAGAKCPKCSTMDSIKVHYIPGAPRYECVQCGHQDFMNLSNDPNEAVVQKRNTEDSVQVLQFDPNPQK